MNCISFENEHFSSAIIGLKLNTIKPTCLFMFMAEATKEISIHYLKRAGIVLNIFGRNSVPSTPILINIQ